MHHNYRVQVTPENATAGEAIEFNFQSHDDLKQIVERVGEKKLFNEEETRTFVVGLKLFSSVLLAHRSEELFAEFAPHFGALMKKLKTS